MVTVACVKVGTKYGDDYVWKLKRGIERYSSGLDFLCFTDKSVDGIACEDVPRDLPGWWAKLHLFAIARPLLYFDLDVVICGSLAPLLAWEGFGILKDNYLAGFNSSIMKLTGNEGHVWEKFRPGIMGMMRGDQDWLNLMMPDARTFPPDWFPSFKLNGYGDTPPEGAIAVNFHGFPKPKQITSGWVPEHWR